MQKSVLVPLEKYQRLLERTSSDNKVTKEASTETDAVAESPLTVESSEPPVIIPKEEIVSETVVEDTNASQKPSSSDEQVRHSLESDKTLKQKRQRRVRPPGLKDYKSMWIKLHGRL